MTKQEKVRSYYERGLWSEKRVFDAVGCGWITSEEFEAITGVPYPAGEDGNA